MVGWNDITEVGVSCRDPGEDTLDGCMERFEDSRDIRAPRIYASEPVSETAVAPRIEAES